jgi:UDP-N-acetylglucosamine 2-epimerase (non-hydrolysing)/GDP/UDP-N,N'-diacetylbacillosamine 2-epimerase (hydrolysing)
MSQRTVAVFTGNRAEYGLQYPILKAIAEHPDLDYRLIVSGAHLDENFGKTLNEIKNDGFEIHAEVKIGMNDDDLFSTAQAIGSGVISMAEALAKIKPDMLVVYADRFEGFAAVITGTQMNVPTAHVEGGDLTEGGALDDSVRHAMTKLSHLHFTTNEQATNRILGMGEETWRVHTVGFPAIDLIQEDNFAKPDELVSQYGLDLKQPVVLFTQHSVTTEFDLADQQIAPSLEALNALALKGVQVIVTYPNNDAGGRRIIDKINEFVGDGRENMQVHRSLGRYNYHGVLALARNPEFKVCCAGNSSSGIKETPALTCPTLNIGSRQDARLRGVNVLDAGYDRNEIMRKIETCLFDEGFRKTCVEGENPYWKGGAGVKVAEVLNQVELNKKLLQKKMTLKGRVQDGWFQ